MTNNTHILQDLVNHPNGMDEYDPNSMSVFKAKQFIKQLLSPIQATESLPIRESLGRVLAADILSPANVPNYDNSAMDGYAFSAQSLLESGASTLKIVSTILAGKTFDYEIKQGECARIMTGGMMPMGTDTVVMQEKVQLSQDCITFTDTIKVGMNVRYAGEDLKISQVVLKQGHLMRPADLGLIASLGIAKVSVYRPLKVAIFSTGDELVSLGQPLALGQVYDSNRYTLFGMLKRLDVEIIDLGAICDDPDLLEATLMQATKQADVVITSGGVSVGEADYMKMLLAKHGQIMFWKIAMKPGRPLAYGKLQGIGGKSAHYFGLPGNPVAVMITFYQFVREALLVLMGQTEIKPFPMLEVTCTENIKKATGRTEYQRGMLTQNELGIWQVKPTGAQGSAILSSMSMANCLIVLDETTGNLEAGAKVKVQVLEGLI